MANENETHKLGLRIGELLRGGEILELVSDVGGGKTTLTKGIVAGLGSSQAVTSPTFTVSKVYSAQGIELHHYDFYRLGKVGLMSEELLEVLSLENAVAVIEWAGETHDLLPKERVVSVELQLQAESESARKLVFTIADKYEDWADALGLNEC